MRQAGSTSGPVAGVEAGTRGSGAGPGVGGGDAGVGVDVGVEGDVEREEEKSAKAICLRLLASSARPRANLAQKLRTRGIGEPVITRVLDRFTEVGLIDDDAYAGAYVAAKQRERALSRHALGAELRRKGVDEAVVSGALESVDTQAEESRAAELLAKRVAGVSAAGPVAARRRLLALLHRRGYPAEMSIRLVDEALSGLSDSVID